MPAVAGKKGRRQNKLVLRPEHLVFVSHATADKWIARMVCEKIEDKGAKSFRDDRDIDGGDDIPETIRTKIKDSQEFVVILTPQSKDRDWVKLELGAAWGFRKRIIIILYHLPTDPIPDTFKAKKAFQLNDIDQYFDELQARVEGVAS